MHSRCLNDFVSCFELPFRRSIVNKAVIESLNVADVALHTTQLLQDIF